MSDTRPLPTAQHPKLPDGASAGAAAIRDLRERLVLAQIQYHGATYTAAQLVDEAKVYEAYITAPLPAAGPTAEEPKP